MEVAAQVYQKMPVLPDSSPETRHQFTVPLFLLNVISSIIPTSRPMGMSIPLPKDPGNKSHTRRSTSGRC